MDTYRFQVPNMISYIEAIVEFERVATTNDTRAESVVTKEGHRAMDVYEAKTRRKLFRAIEWYRQKGEPFEMRVISKVITPEMIDKVVRELGGEANIPSPANNPTPTTHLNPNVFYL